MNTAKGTKRRTSGAAGRKVQCQLARLLPRSPIQTFDYGHRNLDFSGGKRAASKPAGLSFLVLKVLAQQDCFRELLHGFSSLPALSLQCEVGFFLGKLQVALQNSLGAFD